MRRMFSALLLLAAIVVAVGVWVSLPVLWAIFQGLGPAASPHIPAIALQGAAPRTAQLLWSDDLVGQLREVPPETILGIIEVTLPDGSRERRAFLNRAGQPPVYLGPLVRHAAEIPIELLPVEIGNLSLIVGYVDPATHPTRGLVKLYPGGGHTPDVNQLAGATRRMQLSSPCFVAKIQKLRTRREEWDTLGRVVIYENGPGVLKEYVFEPPLDTRPLWIRVP